MDKLRVCSIHAMGFLRLSGKESDYQCSRQEFNLWLGESLKGKWQPTE